MECILCKNLQYIGKSEYQFNYRSNLHNSNVWREYALTSDKHFREKVHDFRKLPKLTVIETLLKQKKLHRLLVNKGDSRHHMTSF